MSADGPGEDGLGRLGRGLVGLLALLYPRDFRHEFRDELRRFVEWQSREERYRDGPVGRVRFWADVLDDAVRSAMEIRAEKRRRRARMNVERWIRELRHAMRSLARRPGFSAVTIVTLGLGIGANTAIFSVIEGALLRPLPFPRADRLVWLSDGNPDLAPSGINQSIPNLMDLKAGSKLLADMAIYTFGSVNVSTEDRPDRVSALVASSELLDVLGTPPLLGRDLLPEDDGVDAPRVALLTYPTWRTRFGSDPGIVGRTTMVDAEPVEIVGVTSPGFYFRGDPEIIVPLRHLGAELSRGSRSWNAIGRLADGATLESLRTELQGIFSRLVEEYPEANENWHAWADPVELFMVGRNAGSLLLFGAAVGLVLLIACVNVANLLLVRTDSRQRDLAVRRAMGAERADLLPHFLSEGLVLALAGGALGLLLAYFGVDGLLVLFGSALVRTRDIGVNGTALAFSLAISLAAGLLVGAVPLARIRGTHLFEHLKDGARGSSVHTNRLGRALVVAEVALAVMVVSGAGLLTNSVWNLQKVQLGVEGEDRVLTFRLSLPRAKYADAASIQGFWSGLQAEVGRIAGVESVGLVNRLPLLGGYNITNTYAYGDHERAAHFVSFRSVTPGYLDAVGVPLLAGRWLDASEFADTLLHSVVINETLARQLFPGDDPAASAVGRLIDPEWNDEGFQVVGVIGDIMGGSATRPAPPAFYYSWTVDPSRAMSVLVRTAGDPVKALPTLRRSVESLDAELPLFEVRTLEQIADGRIRTFRVARTLFGIFAGLALLLGAVGIYGVMSFSVSQRNRELGVRLALGASRSSVLRMVLLQGAGLTLPGVVLGVALALGAGRVLQGFLYQVSPLDVRTYLVVAGVLALTSLTASYVPAYRATRVDPLGSIRAE